MEDTEFTEVSPVEVKTHYVVCPWCGKNASTVDHMMDADQETAWYCDHCGEHFGLKFKGGKMWTKKIPGEKHIKTLVLLRHGDIGLVVEGMTFQNSGAGGEEYFYNEHTCPTNYLKKVKVIIDLKRGDTDPHGIFQFVGVRPYDPRIEECNLSNDELAKIIGFDQFQLAPPKA